MGSVYSLQDLEAIVLVFTTEVRQTGGQAEERRDDEENLKRSV